MQSIRGTRDIFNNQADNFDNIVNCTSKIAKLHNFQRLIIPSLEYSELFERNVGSDTDIVSKEIYKFLDKGQNLIALRPEFTAGVVRALVENSELRSAKVPIKLFSYGSLFRYERPQNGRYREFYQLNFEIFGKNSTNHDLETLVLANKILKALKIDNIEFHLNFMGGSKTKAKYIQYLSDTFSKYRYELSQDSKNRLDSGKPLRILDSKDENDKKISAEIEPISKFYTNENIARNAVMAEALAELDIKFKMNKDLVRGLDYYTDMVFEAVNIDKSCKLQNALCGGGRYDSMINQVSNTKLNLAAVGFAIGIDRLLLLLNDSTTNNIMKIAIIPAKNEYLAFCHQIITKLSTEKLDIAIEIMTHGDTISKNIKRASEMNFSHIIIIEENEMSTREVKMKKLNSNEEIIYKI